MRVVLSRKGYDSASGGMPSPIMPDGTLLSLPIPAKDTSIAYADLYYNGTSYFDIIQQLKPTSRIKENWTCHLDPDLVEGVTKRTVPWYPLFGQSNQSQKHLSQNGIGVGDMFLFWGWFRQTAYHEGKLRFLSYAPDHHIIWGYMKIAKVSTGIQMPPEYTYHPHGLIKSPMNAIYEGDSQSTGLLRYDAKRVLTKKGMSRSKWDLPVFFRNLSISYHTSESFKDGYFQSAMRGQEFVIEESKEVDEWAKIIVLE